MKRGNVVLAGAGPGDPGLVSVRALECIKEADVIVYDRLVSSQLLSAARSDARMVYVGKAANEHTMKQEDINTLLVQFAREGKAVLRLKGGDPFVFGRGGEEALFLRENGVPFEVVPGITSAVAVPAYAGIPVTHRGVAASFAVVTGHEDPAKIATSLRWKELSTAVDTLVFLMGVENLPYITAKLMENGRPADTPAAVIRWGTTPSQVTLVTTVGGAVADVACHDIQPPAIFVVGEVVNLRESLRWFDRRPLFCKTVLVTRAREQASKLIVGLEAAGAVCIEAPTIRIAPPDDFAPLDMAVAALADYTWVIFTSSNGVEMFFRRLHRWKKDARAFASARVAAIGPETAAELERRGIVADVVPGEFRAEAVVAALRGKVGPMDCILIPRAEQARDVLPAELVKFGARVDVVTAYRTKIGGADGPALARRLAAGEIDIVTFTSSSTVTNLLEILGKDGCKLLAHARIACIGPVTAETCRDHGLAPAIVAEEYTIKGLTASIIQELGGETHE